ncbi:MAG: ROK family protein [Lachnospiraceae bacterium]|nr:ROK family protein [Lachnospiraceae bacterium]
MLYGALEAGGTKMVCAVGTEDGKIIDRIQLPTETPDVTISAIIDYFKDKELKALGIACFGPVDLNISSPTYGYITNTPKPGWSNTDIAGTFEKALSVPVGFDTDVAGSLIGEVTYGSSKGLKNVVYITVGTGIGGGVMAEGRILHGMMHPELGHMVMHIHPEDSYKCRCPFHDHCLEGLACGLAVEERRGLKGKDIPDDDKVWEIEAYYLGQAMVNLILTLSPERIILGGGIMHRTFLFDMIRQETKKQLNSYVKTALLDDLNNYIVPASLNDDQGILGCIKLAMEAV